MGGPTIKNVRAAGAHTAQIASAWLCRICTSATAPTVEEYRFDIIDKQLIGAEEDCDGNHENQYKT
jgi:hypothetical protein